MARRPLLTDEERRLLFGVPGDPDALARHYTFTRSDQDLLAGRRGDTNRLGFAVQLALLRHPAISDGAEAAAQEGRTDRLVYDGDGPDGIGRQRARSACTSSPHRSGLARLRHPAPTSVRSRSVE